MNVLNRFYALMFIAASLSLMSCGDDESNSTEEQDEQEDSTEETTIGGEIAEAIDLGLSVKWASHNLGASAPEEDGGLYGWGDPTGNRIDKHTPPTDYYKDISGGQYDIAHIHWGGKWRLPTRTEQLELARNCKWELVRDGMIGVKVTGPNGNSIFLPAAGYYNYNGLEDKASVGYYWSSEVKAMDASKGYPYYSFFTTNPTQLHWTWSVEGNMSGGGQFRVRSNYGLSVRPVTE